MALIPYQKKKKPPIVPATNTQKSGQNTQMSAMNIGGSTPIGAQPAPMAGANKLQSWRPPTQSGPSRHDDGIGNRTGHASGNFGFDPNKRVSPGHPDGVPQAAPPPKSQEELADQALRELLAGGARDTTADEQQIQEMLRHTVGSGQADLNARLGAGGFGTSGALGALSGDMRAMAARQAAEEIMGVRQGARDEYYDRIRSGLDASATDRGLDIREDAYGRYLDAIEAALGKGGASSAPGPFVDETLDPGGDFWKTGDQAIDEQERRRARDDDSRPATEWEDVEEPAEDAVRLNISDNDPNYDYYSDGTRVRK